MNFEKSKNAVIDKVIKIIRKITKCFMLDTFWLLIMRA